MPPLENDHSTQVTAQIPSDQRLPTNRAPLPKRPARQPLSPSAAAGLSRRQLRHWAELPLLVLCGAVTAFGIGVAATAAGSGMEVPTWAGTAAVGITVPLIAATVAIRWMYWREISSSVEITCRQLSALHAIYVGLVTAMGMSYVPRLYVSNSNGTLLAWASKCRVRRGYIVIGSDLVDLAYEHGDIDTVRFVLAHELAHIRCGHVDLWRTGITALPRLIGLDRSLTRAQEYTADRTAALHAPAGAAGLLVLFAGKRVYRHLDVNAYHESVRAHRDGLWLRLVNLWADHPVGFRRMEALAGVTADGSGWDTHGRMV